MITITGRGGGHTSPISLSGGDYELYWAVGASPSDEGCVPRLTLRSDDLGYSQTLVGVSDAISRGGSKMLPGLQRGRYFLDLDPHCSTWVVTLVRR